MKQYLAKPVMDLYNPNTNSILFLKESQVKSSTLLKSVVPAQQKRSRKVEKKLITTVTKMLNTGVPYEEISVGDIARKAGISVGGFYARFGSKESLLLAALVSTPLDELGIALRDFLNSAVSNHLSVREIIRGNWQYSLTLMWNTSSCFVKRHYIFGAMYSQT